LLHFPSFKVSPVNRLPILDIDDEAVLAPLAECWQATRGETVGPNRDGYSAVRRR